MAASSESRAHYAGFTIYQGRIGKDASKILGRLDQHKILTKGLRTDRPGHYAGLTLSQFREFGKATHARSPHKLKVQKKNGKPVIVYFHE